VYQTNDKWNLEIHNNQLKKIYLQGLGSVSIEETPDMRAHLLKKMGKQLNLEVNEEFYESFKNKIIFLHFSYFLN